MREIKFRSWDKENKRMCRMYSLILPNTTGTESEERNKIYMQYTGLKDKNDVEIFESDIVSYYDDGGVAKIIGKVVFDRFGWSMEGQYHFNSWIADMEVDDIQVIGNIWENPELLDKGDKR